MLILCLNKFDILWAEKFIWTFKAKCDSLKKYGILDRKLNAMSLKFWRKMCPPLFLVGGPWTEKLEKHFFCYRPWHLVPELFGFWGCTRHPSCPWFVPGVVGELRSDFPLYLGTRRSSISSWWPEALRHEAVAPHQQWGLQRWHQARLTPFLCHKTSTYLMAQE